jgi:hypothetical protein
MIERGDGYVEFEDGTIMQDDRCKDRVLVPYFDKMMELCGRPWACNVCIKRDNDAWAKEHPKEYQEWLEKQKV